MLIEEAIHAGLLICAQLFPAQQTDSCFGECRKDIVVQNMGLFALEVVGVGPNRFQDFARGQTTRCPNRNARCNAALEARHAHHEELVEVAREDRQELRPIQDCDFGVGSQLQNAPIESQPRQLPIEEPILGERVDLNGRGAHASMVA